MYILAWSLFFGGISPWWHLLKSGSSRSACLFIIWLRNDWNFAQITIPGTPVEMIFTGLYPFF